MRYPVTVFFATVAVLLPVFVLADVFAEEAARQITAQTIRQHVSILASDEYGGRGPATEGDQLTRTYIAEQLASLGFEPGGDNGTWEQRFPIVGVTAHPPKEWSFRGASESVALSFWDEFMAVSGVQAKRVEVPECELVFVGYGIEAPEEDWNDFKGVDLTGKILVMLNNDPDWDDSFGGSKRLYYGRWTYKYESAARQGAAGALIIHTTPSAGYGWNVVQSGWNGEQFELPAGDESRIKVPGWLTWEAAQRIASLGGHDLEDLAQQARSRDFQPVPLGVRTSLGFDVDVAQKETANVAGLLRGSDPELQNQVVVYTAHHDHLGVGEPNDAGDSIYNGAVDNAAGVGSILNVAKAWASLPQRPRRSLLILAVAAEEQGLLGSRWYSRNPTFHPGRIAANINIDGGNILGRTSDVAVVGKGKSNLEDVLATHAAKQGRVVVNEPYPDKGYYYRSDQLNFARIGVPALYFKSGKSYLDRPEGWGEERENEWRAKHYHQPSDELSDDWNLEGMVEDVQLALWVGLTVANQDDMAAWNRGDEFELKRKKAIAATESR